MPLHDYRCQSCGYEDDKIVSYKEMNDLWDCPECSGSMKHVWKKAPSAGTIGKEGSDTEIAAMKKSFKQRAVKKNSTTYAISMVGRSMIP